MTIFLFSGGQKAEQTKSRKELIIYCGMAMIMPMQEIAKIVEQYLQSPEFAQLFARFPSVSFTTETAGNLGIFSGSSVHISKVLMNLVTNAAEAMRDRVLYAYPPPMPHYNRK